MKKTGNISSKIIEMDNFLININQIIEELGSKEGQPNKKYRPTNKSFEKMTEINEYLKPYVRAFSPYTDGLMDEKNIYEDLFNKMFPFKFKQIQKMELDTKKEIIKNTLVGLRLTFSYFRKDILPWDALFREDYQTDKLKFMVEYQREPIVYEMDEYLHIEECFIKIMKKALNIYLLVDEQETHINHYLGFQKSKDLMIEYYLMVLEKKKHIYSWYEDKIITHFERKISTGTLTETEINLYLNMTKCLFTEKAMRKCEVDMRPSNIVFVSGGLYNAIFICEHIHSLNKLISINNMKLLLDVTYNYLEKINEYFANKSVTQFSGIKRKEIANFLEVVPTFINYVKTLRE